MKKLIKNSSICILMTAATVMFAGNEHKTRKNMKLSDLPPIPHAPRMPVRNNNQVENFLKTQPKIIAMYGTEAITVKSIQKSFAMAMQMGHVKMNNAQLKTKLIQHLSGKMEQKVLFHHATEAGFKTSTDKVNTEFTSLAARYGGAPRLAQILKMQGMNPVSFKKDMGENFAIREYLESEKKKLVISDREIEIYYNTHKPQFTLPEKQIRASHIMAGFPLKATESQKAEAKKKITTILAQLKQGKSFTALAKQVSDCPSGKRSSGDIGFFTAKDPRMDQSFSKAASTLKVGEMSGIVKSQFGYHIIKVTEIRKAGLATLAEAEDVIIRQLRQSKMKKKVKEMIDGETKNGTIKYFVK